MHFRFKNVSHFAHAIKENITLALADVAQWIEHGPVTQTVCSSIPGQSTCLGCRPGPQ